MQYHIGKNVQHHHPDLRSVHGDLRHHAHPALRCIYTDGRYGVNIHLNDSSLANDLFTGNFDSEYIVEVMDLLERHYDFTYDVRGDDIFIHP